MIQFLPQKFSKIHWFLDNQAVFYYFLQLYQIQSHKNVRRKTLTAQNFCRFLKFWKERMSENQTPTAILDQTRKVHQKNLGDKSSEEVNRQKALIKMMIEQYERKLIIQKKVQEAKLRQMNQKIAEVRKESDALKVKYNLN